MKEDHLWSTKGSILGPILFNIFIFDMFLFLH